MLIPTDSALAVDWFVDAEVTASGSGQGSWANAKKHLRDVLDDLNLAAGDVIKVKGATGAGLVYYPDQYWNGSSTVDTNDPTDSFMVGSATVDQLVIEGQYTGADLTTRNPIYRTILSGAISATDNSHHVVRIDNSIDDDTVIDGLEIRDGRADGNCTGAGDCSTSNGGGLYTEVGTPDIRNIVFADNRAVFTTTQPPGDIDALSGCGGGLYSRAGTTLTVRDCLFTNNIAATGGGLASGKPIAWVVLAHASIGGRLNEFELQDHGVSG